MSTTDLLGINEVAASQNQKEVTINDAIVALEQAFQRTLAVDMWGVTLLLPRPSSPVMSRSSAPVTPPPLT